ncbi:hypothetical protein [Streptomyces mirabilis]|uniref:hypothetical protein n=1 Tax=Streptomyces mirabilis TaxID=68239 RepID=UPI00332D6BAF
MTGKVHGGWRRHLAQFGAAVRGLDTAGARLFAGGPGGAGESVDERVELEQSPAVVAAEDADRCLFNAQAEDLAVAGAERQGRRLDNVASVPLGACAHRC